MSLVIKTPKVLKELLEKRQRRFNLETCHVWGLLVNNQTPADPLGAVPLMNPAPNNSRNNGRLSGESIQFLTERSLLEPLDWFTISEGFP